VEENLSEYQATPADLERIESVHALITKHADKFRAAAADIDTRYSRASILTRVEEQSRPSERVATTSQTAALPRVPLGVARAIFTDLIPSRLMHVRGDRWDSPNLRWQVLLFNLIDCELPSRLPGAHWAHSARVLLTYWATCDKRAEGGPMLSGFQAWRWHDESLDCRSIGRLFVKDWPKLNRAVDLALADAKRRGLGPSPDGATGRAPGSEISRSPS